MALTWLYWTHASQKETLAELRSVSYTGFGLCYGEIRSFRFRLSFKQNLLKDLEGFLRSQEECWVKSAV
jgi:hypothetical protein